MSVGTSIGMSTHPARPGGRAGPDRHALLRRSARRLYRDRVKPGLKRGLLDVRPQAKLGVQDYVVDAADNLLPGLSVRDIEGEFTAGAGGELRDKMRAPWSSAALAVNAFLPWRLRREAVPVLDLGPFARPFAFEAKCPNRVSPTPPHLDALFRLERQTVGVESKCTEFIQGSTHPAVSARYLALEAANDPRVSSNWFPLLASTAEFALLNSAQLVKHYLGLRNTYPDDELVLVYLYWEPTNAEAEPVFRAHRDEVARFADRVAGDMTCRFVPASYADLWRQWASLSGAPVWLAGHLELLRRRYLVEI
jgi:hypothetical protein